MFLFEFWALKWIRVREFESKRERETVNELKLEVERH